MHQLVIECWFASLQEVGPFTKFSILASQAVRNIDKAADQA